MAKHPCGNGGVPEAQRAKRLALWGDGARILALFEIWIHRGAEICTESYLGGVGRDGERAVMDSMVRSLHSQEGS